MAFSLKAGLGGPSSKHSHKPPRTPWVLRGIPGCPELPPPGQEDDSREGHSRGPWTNMASFLGCAF